MKVKVKSRDSGESDMHMKNMGCKEKRKVIACVCIVSGVVWSGLLGPSTINNVRLPCYASSGTVN